MKNSKGIRTKIVVLFWFILTLWIIHFVNLFSGYGLNNFGIYPRSLDGIYGILFAPFLHGGLTHLLLNTIPLAIMGGIIILRSIKEFFLISLIITFISGVAIWIFGRDAYHIGASGLIFGYFGYLVACGWFERTASSIIIAAIIFFLYGGMIFYLIPTNSRVSWEAHLFGFLAGIIGAKILHNRKKTSDDSIEHG